jgi:hypothetical protein
VAEITDWVGEEAARGAATVDLALHRRYVVTVKRVIGKDWTFDVVGRLVAKRNGGRKFEFVTDHGVKAEVWANTIVNVKEAA